MPIVFAQGIDPVGGGTVASLPRPGGNVTGFLQFEYSLAGKWLELLKEIVPQITRVGVVREAGAGGIGQWAVIGAVAPSFGVEMRALSLNDTAGIERAFSSFASEPDGGLIVAVVRCRRCIAT